MERQDLRPTLIHAATLLDLDLPDLRRAIADWIGVAFKKRAKALLNCFNYSAVNALADATGTPERTVQSHLNADSKPGKKWRVYRKWFESEIPKGVAEGDTQIALEHLEHATKMHELWEIWSVSGRPRLGHELPDNLGDAQSIMCAVRDLLERNGETLETAPTTIPRLVAQAPRSPVILEVPFDLQPPTWNAIISRQKYSESLSGLNGQFVAVLEGPPLSGKSYTLLDYLRSQNKPVLWYHLTDTSTLAEVSSRLSETIGSGRTVGHIQAKLKELDLCLVLDGVNALNVGTFLQAIQVSANLPGPLHIFVSSTARIERANALEMSPMSRAEIESFLQNSGVVAEPQEVSALCDIGNLFPLVLMRAIADSGGNIKSVVERVRLNGDDLDVHLGLTDRQAVDLVSLMGVEFDMQTFEYALEILEVDEPAASVLNRLDLCFIVKRLSRVTWLIQQSPRPEIGTTVPRELQVQFLTELGSYWENLASGDGNPRKQQNREECLCGYRACRAFQLAEARSAHKSRLLKWLPAKLSQHGLFAELRQLCDFEVANNAHRSRWIDHKLARCLHVLGDLAAELNTLQGIFYSEVKAPTAPSLFLSTQRSIAELLIDLGHAELAFRILDAALKQSTVSKLDHLVAVQAVSILSWALMHKGQIVESIKLNEQYLGKDFVGLEPPVAEAVRRTRQGIAFRLTGDLRQSLIELTRANELFALNDRRGYAWSAINLAEGYRLVGDFDSAQLRFKEALEITAMHGMFDADLYGICDGFSKDLNCSGVQVDALREMERLSGYEKARHALADKVPNMKFFEHVLLAARAATTSEQVDFAPYRLMPTTSTHKVASDFNRTLINGVTKDNGESQLELIFQNNAADAIFSQPIYNKLITRTCQLAPFLANKFIEPYLEIVLNSTDSIRLHYARYFELVRDIATAENLLNSLGDKDTYEFFNVKANCASHDPKRADEAMWLNEQALTRARSAFARGRIQFNMAKLVYERYSTSHFQWAIDLCEQAIAVDKSGDFFWPRNLILKLQLALSHESKFPDTIRSHQNRFGYSWEHIGSKIIAQIGDARVRRAAFASLSQFRLRQQNLKP